MLFLCLFAKTVILLSLVMSLVACGSSSDDENVASDPCGTVIDLAPVGDYVSATFEPDDCRFWDILPGTTFGGFVDEYRITVNIGGPVEIDITSGCFDSELYLLNTPTSCSSGCGPRSHFNSLILAHSVGVFEPYDTTDDAHINIDLIAGTYLILAVGPTSPGSCNRYPIRT